MDEPNQGIVPDLSKQEWRQRIETLHRNAQVGASVNGVAHDLNNFLGAIMAYAELIGLDTPLPDESRRMLDELLNAVKKSSNLVSNLTGIARPPKPALSPIDLSALIERVVSIRNYDFTSAGIALRTHLPEQPPTVVCDRSSLELALTYLLSNSLDSLKEHGTGTTTIRLTADETHARISVSDSQLPVPPEVAERMFEAFYTTREDGHVGLSLYAARKITDLHDGALVYDDTDGFTIAVPRVGPLAGALADGA